MRNLLENITLSQAIDLYNPGPADMELDYFVDFDLLAKKEGGSNIPVGRYEHFVNDNNLKYLLNSTENKKHAEEHKLIGKYIQRLAFRSDDDDGGPDPGYSGLLSRGASFLAIKICCLNATQGWQGLPF